MSDSGNAPIPGTGPAHRSAAPAAPVRRISVIPICIALVIVTALIVGLIAWLRLVDGVAGTISGIAKEFHDETITETFHLDRLRVIASEGSNLDLATAECTEVFTRKSSVTLWDQLVPLGTTESEITVPVTYRYHIDLDGDWSVSTRGGTCIVMAPMFEPSLPVAFDTGGIQKKTRSGWARFDKGENLEALEKSITARLAERAGSHANFEDVREECRRSVTRFVQNWLLREDHWKEDRFNEITVIFPDEVGAAD